MSEPENSKITYQDAGVDIDLADRMIKSWLPQINRTSKSEQVGSQLGFGGLFEVPQGYEQPVLVSSTDGVGTKLKIAFELNKHDTVGIDLVAMCVNDIIVYGAKPLYFLDYIATGQLDEEVLGQVMAGIVRGCEIAGAALIGGETAEMPGMYSAGEYDLAGFSVGIVEKANIVDPDRVEVGDVVIGIESTGVHSNGFSLVRKLIEKNQVSLDESCAGRPLGEVLLEPTRIYADSVLAIVPSGEVHALAHITGGGLPGNIQRVMPKGLSARLNRQSWPTQPIFDWIQSQSNLDDEEMMETFNCGIGMVAIVSQQAEAEIRNQLDALDLPAYTIGAVTPSDKTTTQIE